MLISPWKGAQVKPDASLSQDGYVQSLKIDTKFENEFENWFLEFAEDAVQNVRDVLI